MYLLFLVQFKPLVNNVEMGYENLSRKNSFLVSNFFAYKIIIIGFKIYIFCVIKYFFLFIYLLIRPSRLTDHETLGMNDNL